ncbi:MAG: hypothetical protein J5663_03135 [Bacteroidaceae bacterium]|nr:hypothetical protein [Bacteroidaceae bacterium]
MNKTIDDILNGMKGQQPTPPDADLLTEQIMMNLPDIQLDATDEEEAARQQQGGGKAETIINIVRAVSSVAAIWLVGLFAYSYVTTSSPINDNEKVIAINHTSIKTNNSSFSSTLNVVYTNLKEKNKIHSYAMVKNN